MMARSTPFIDKGLLLIGGCESGLSGSLFVCLLCVGVNLGLVGIRPVLEGQTHPPFSKLGNMGSTFVGRQGFHHPWCKKSEGLPIYCGGNRKYWVCLARCVKLYKYIACGLRLITNAGLVCSDCPAGRLLIEPI